ncbi:hypothetical protein [Clostridium massiliodielmoense]|nr:hypothetical protein [Clostridium massiliodielmoense]
MTLKELKIKIEDEIKVNKEIKEEDLDIEIIVKNIIKINEDAN